MGRDKYSNIDYAKETKTDDLDKLTPNKVVDSAKVDVKKALEYEKKMYGNNA